MAANVARTILQNIVSHRWFLHLAEQKAVKFCLELWTGEHTQLVLMATPARGEIQEGYDQLLYFVEGNGEAATHAKEVNKVYFGPASI